jgi:hypothetical protein
MQGVFVNRLSSPHHWDDSGGGVHLKSAKLASPNCGRTAHMLEIGRQSAHHYKLGRDERSCDLRNSRLCEALALAI